MEKVKASNHCRLILELCPTPKLYLDSFVLFALSSSIFDAFLWCLKVSAATGNTKVLPCAG